MDSFGKIKYILYSCSFMMLETCLSYLSLNLELYPFRLIMLIL